MKHIGTLIIACLFPFIFCSAQASFGVSGGYASDGIGAHASYNYETISNGYFQVSLFASDNESSVGEVEVPFRTIFLNLGYYHTVVRNRSEQLSLALGGGGTLGYEILNDGDTILDTGAIIAGNEGLVFGGFVGAELQYFLSDSFALLLVENTQIYGNSQLGTLSIYAGLGIRFYIN